MDQATSLSNGADHVRRPFRRLRLHLGWQCPYRQVKQDLFKRRVSSDEAFKYANSNNLKYIETSAKNKASVDGLFYEINKSILKNALESKNKVEGVFRDFKRDYTRDSLEDYNCRECCLIS